MTNEDIDHLARKRAKAKIGWFIHATVYATVNMMLIGLSLYTGRGWAIFPLLGWGLGLALHGASVWLFAPGGNLLERMVAHERAKLDASHGDPW